jgi:hypothetical protein
MQILSIGGSLSTGARIQAEEGGFGKKRSAFFLHGVNNYYRVASVASGGKIAFTKIRSVYDRSACH